MRAKEEVKEIMDGLLSKLAQAKDLVEEVKQNELIKGSINNYLQEVKDILNTVEYKIKKLMGLENTIK